MTYWINIFGNYPKMNAFDFISTFLVAMIIFPISAYFIYQSESEKCKAKGEKMTFLILRKRFLELWGLDQLKKATVYSFIFAVVIFIFSALMFRYEYINQSSGFVFKIDRLTGELYKLESNNDSKNKLIWKRYNDGSK